MNQIILDNETTKQFAKAQEMSSVLDSEGNVVGYFTPGYDIAEIYALAKADISDEELDRRAKEPSRPLNEIIADLEKRA